MESKYTELNKYSSGYLLKAAVRNLFKKKSVRLTVSVFAVVVSLFVLKIVYQYYALAVWWLNTLFELPLFIVFTAGVGGFVSNIGKFDLRKFIAGSTVGEIVMWVAMAFDRVIAFAYLPIDWSLCLPAIGLELLKYLPLLIISLAVVLVPVMICSRGKKEK